MKIGKFLYPFIIVVLIIGCGDSSQKSQLEFYNFKPNDQIVISLKQYEDSIKSLDLSDEDKHVLLDTATTNYLNNEGRIAILRYWTRRVNILSEKADTVIGGMKVIQGTSTSASELPFMVGIQNRGGKFKCGGTIIGDRWILTAEHCLRKLRNKYDIRFLIGTNLNLGKGDTLRVDSLHLHPRASSGFNDIGLIELRNPLQNKYKNIAIVDFPQQDENVVSPGDDVSVAGWGWINAAGDNSKVLLKGTLKLADLQKCKDQGHCMLDETHLSTQNASVDICYNDSGGPLYIDRTINDITEKFQVGIIQRTCTERCGSTTCNKFVNLAKYRNWIDSTMNQPSINIQADNLEAELASPLTLTD